ncbi:MAG: PSD1 and planctomycete cytochrome C domain-containing protein [Planctomycetes bacterium]|nr:PSD1 and planctomycete cytochrome C domain-containing protein [Planctomycetota bacterium]
MPRLLPILCIVALTSPVTAADPKVDFARDVLPILSDKCFQCHGPDEKARKADLRLDLKEEALKAPVIVAGKADASELVERLAPADPAELMPPVKSNKKLSAAEIATLKAWINQGAAWGQHWAFVKPERPKVPTINNPQFTINNPIDAFIAQRLIREKLSQSPPAEKERLIRRVTLDLTGLPPTLEEVDAFLKDDSPQAYEKVVDRLLGSPRYGERMAWDWLDAARYADSNGYQGDGERTMWPWRDWVIRAFNDNMPYDRFTVEQLAGDLLPNPTKEQILATGFNRNHMINGEGGRIAEENRVEYVFDQAETTGTIWLGLTFTCSRCHDHKFDPISKRDYYSLFAYFNQSPVNGGGGNGQTPPVIDFASPEQEKKRKEAQAAYDTLVIRIVPIERKLREAGMVKNKEGKYETTLPQLIESALRKGPNDRADQNYDELIKHFKDKEPEYVALLPNLRKAKQARDAAAQGVPKVMVMAELPAPRETFMFTRGDYQKKEGKVVPGTPTFGKAEGGRQKGDAAFGSVLGFSAFRLPPSAFPRENRLDLARWIVSPENPLTARVTVNRLWQTFFGIGLVKTTEDFGVQSERPSHPELLDWLAVEFQNPTPNPLPQGERGLNPAPPSFPGKGVGGVGSPQPWDVKHMVRLMVTSAAYRQSSVVTPELRERDPDNRLLARGARHRLPAWMIRDQALAASGLLTSTIGGPAVKPYQPAGIWEEATFGNKRYQQDKGDALYRRSLYVFWRRIVGPTMFFDAASRQTCSVKGTTTNTPLHALATLNDITYVEAARALAQLAMEKGGATDAERVAFAFRRVTARKPTDTQVKILVAGVEKQRVLFAEDKAAAATLLKTGDSPRNEKLDATDHAALTVVCSLILNLDEVLNK